MKKLKDTPLIQGWERDARRMPIDHMGPGFGGRAHRVRSAGHDIGRPFEALSQIRDGQFRGFRWDHGVKIPVTDDRYRVVESLGKGLAGVRHVNVPVLVRAAMVALQVAADARARTSVGRSWEDLLADVAAPWQLDTADEVDRAFAGCG